MKILQQIQHKIPKQSKIIPQIIEKEEKRVICKDIKPEEQDLSYDFFICTCSHSENNHLNSKDEYVPCVYNILLGYCDCVEYRPKLLSIDIGVKRDLSKKSFEKFLYSIEMPLLNSRTGIYWKYWERFLEGEF